MDFESPDVEKDFPGLYASESVKKCNESDFSDENHDKSFKKDLIIGKKKEKKDSKKDRGYAALEGESSPDEDDSKSPSKSKKTKAFKFPTKKSEKREKSREKDVKEKEKEPDKDRKKEKDKKEKVKHKEKKKSKHGEELSEQSDEYPIFGVPLSIAVERSGCLDGIAIPLIVRNCIDCIHNAGLTMDGLYKVTGVKSKIQAFRKSYNLREPVSLTDCDVPVATCLLRTFLRELPDPILTNDLLARFEEAGAIKEVGAREAELSNLLKQLPHYNRILLAWLIVHFDTVTMHEKHNKLNAQLIAMTFSPVLQMSHRLLTALLCHCKALFPDTEIQRYVPPLCAGNAFPENPKDMAIELKKQESLLNQIHREMSEGFTSKQREEQLWEVQRIVTQLKRKLRTLQRSQEITQTQRSLDEDQTPNEDSNADTAKKSARENEENLKRPTDVGENIMEKKSKVGTEGISVTQEDAKTIEIATIECTEIDSQGNWDDNHGDTQENTSSSSSERQAVKNSTIEPIKSAAASNEWNLQELKLQLEHGHLLILQSRLQDRIDNERLLVERLRTEIHNCRGDSDSPSETSSNESTPPCLSPESESRMDQLIEENSILQQKKDDLVRKILEEREACIKLAVCINLMELSGHGE